MPTDEGGDPVSLGPENGVTVSVPRDTDLSDSEIREAVGECIRDLGHGMRDADERSLVDLEPVSDRTEVSSLLDARLGDYVKVVYTDQTHDARQVRWGFITAIDKDDNYFYGVELSKSTEGGPEKICKLNAQDIVHNIAGRKIGEVVEITHEANHD